MLIWCMRGSILNGILVCVCVCVCVDVSLSWMTYWKTQSTSPWLSITHTAGRFMRGVFVSSQCWLMWSDTSVWDIRHTHTHTHTHTMSPTQQYNTRWSVNTQPRFCLFKYFLEVSCFNMKYIFVWCKMIFFWSLLWIIWFHEKLLEQNINTINWLPAYKKKMFTHEQLKMISPPCFLFCSAKQYIRFWFHFLSCF